MYTQYILNQNIYRSKFRGNIELFWAKAISGFYTKYFGSYSLWYRISWMNCRKYKHFPQVNTGWLAFLRTWYYSRLCFSFSCAGCDHVVIKKSHTLNWYSLLVTVAAQFTIKTTNSKKAIYFWSLMSKIVCVHVCIWGERGRGCASQCPRSCELKAESFEGISLQLFKNRKTWANLH